jgi:23S rRNA (adenine2503-C2)-methyltransferase
MDFFVPSHLALHQVAKIHNHHQTHSHFRNTFPFMHDAREAVSNLFGKTLPELEQIVDGYGMPSFAARQLAEWMYKKGAAEIDQMSNLSKAFRSSLSERFFIDLHPPVHIQQSVDGTRKYLFATSGGQYVEAVYLPEKSRHTLCLSTQAGCRMACSFCMTGRQGFQGQLSAGDILNQVRSLPERDLLTNIVYMGMGEPFDNLEAVLKSLEILTETYGYAMSPKRITVSTIGIISAMESFLAKSRCNLAVSLHTPFDAERRKLMPIEHNNPLKDVLKTIRSFPLEKQRRVSFEYIVFEGLNHSPAHVKELARVLNGIRCRINLLRFHSLPGSDLRSPDENTMETFKTALEEKGLITTIRRSRGQDIMAACGLLSTTHRSE